MGTCPDITWLVDILPEILKIIAQTVTGLRNLQVFLTNICTLEGCSDELRRKLKDCQFCFQTVILHSGIWNREIRDFLSYVEKNSTVEVDDVAYANQFHRFIGRIDDFYNEVKVNLDEVKATCESAVALSGKTRREAKVKKKTTQVVGGTVAGVFFGTGVSLSIAAGVFTLGVGTVIGLGITSGITTLAGAGASLGTYLSAANYENIENTCRKEYKNFDDFLDEIHALNVKMQTLVTKVNFIKQQLEDAGKNALDKKHKKYTVALRGVKECRETLKKHQEELDAFSKSFERLNTDV